MFFARSMWCGMFSTILCDVECSLLDHCDVECSLLDVCDVEYLC